MSSLSGIFKTATERSKDQERIAFNLGMGDGKALEASGLMARSNAAIASLNDLQGRKEKDKRLEDLIHSQILKSLGAIDEEMNWLDDQIKIEGKAIQRNNADIDFIRSLNEDNIMGGDGAPRSDVQTFLKKHGYNDTDDLALDEVQLILQTIETDLHNDNIIRTDRIEGYKERHGALREHAGQMADNTTGAAKQQAHELAARETPEVTARAVMELSSDNITMASVEATALEQRLEVETDSFSLPTLS